MFFEFKLPDLGEGITEGEVVKWRVKEGERVAEHQVALEVETDKAIVEVPCPRSGRVVKINTAEGQTVKVGGTLFTIEVDAAPGEEKRPAGKSLSVVGTLPSEEAAYASPKARTTAKKLGVELDSVAGTGPGGIITEKDVYAHLSDKAGGVSEPGQTGTGLPPKLGAPEGVDRLGPIERIQIKGIRKAITKNLLTSQKNAAFVTGMDEADVSELWDLRERERKAAKEKGIHLTFIPFFMKSVYHALAQHPLFNASVDETGEFITIKKYYNIGVAVDTNDGLMVPVVKGVDKKTILELAMELQGLSKKAVERKITLEELKGSTFTITNYGTYGGTFATPIINYPDVAILGTGKIAERPWVKNGAVVVRKILPLSLTFDHRVTDGADAAKFLTKIVNYLEDPARIFIESA
ncbi:MAG: 2-oxo acid dehydrogenase subunit E2 [Deltaproteobacteria bacterium]|nr:2-oxo acid dehydrogenase subunit E2 [Deltaproteobacteria bacterium]